MTLNNLDYKINREYNSFLSACKRYGIVLNENIMNLVKAHLQCGMASAYDLGKYEVNETLKSGKGVHVKGVKNERRIKKD